MFYYNILLNNALEEGIESNYAFICIKKIFLSIKLIALLFLENTLTQKEGLFILSSQIL